MWSIPSPGVFGNSQSEGPGWPAGFSGVVEAVEAEEFTLPWAADEAAKIARQFLLVTIRDGLLGP